MNAVLLAIAAACGLAALILGLVWAFLYWRQVRALKAQLREERKCDAQRLCEWNEAAGTIAVNPEHLECTASENGKRVDYKLHDGSVYIVSMGPYSTRAFWDQGRAR